MLFVVSIIGGSGSGKSRLGKGISQKYKAEIIDSDCVYEKGLYGEDLRNTKIDYIKNQLRVLSEAFSPILLPEFLMVRDESRREILEYLSELGLTLYTIILDPSWENIQKSLEYRQKNHPSYSLENGRIWYDIFHEFKNENPGLLRDPQTIVIKNSVFTGSEEGVSSKIIDEIVNTMKQKFNISFEKRNNS